ncbi:pyridoxamine 5'-phosphate oxidase family protein [Pelagibius sp. Alg239-R121]|uniref:pyridoxamine 5'-phosphate oxidase family protein n=1 Tax=Pelagibius sp. Alg239-R121 TaxID=2993448 RepID=UPI0024A750B9|nr:pyridoxamine 5'-phosphate oxidase family protein [Pelagibius sp. Alg239-R121]
MTEPGWNAEGSPFHEGEQEAQARAGVRERMERIGRRVVRDFMPDQHRQFFAKLSTLLIGHVDGQGRPWASILIGQPGFITSPDPRQLHIAAEPLAGSPLSGELLEGMDVGLLGLEFHSRRRNRMNGKVVTLRPGAFSVKVDQSFGNCPKFIQTRNLVSNGSTVGDLQPTATRADFFGPAQRRLIEQADTFFITSQFSQDRDDATQGADVSHRGGKPGFVRCEGDRQILWPDFHGNAHFNTIGNILRNPKSGLLFLDFATGDLLYITGTSEVIWEGAEVEAFEGAERLMRFTVTELIYVEAALPFEWEFQAFSPVLDKTGSWEPL